VAAESYTITALGPLGGLSADSAVSTSGMSTGWLDTSNGYSNAFLSDNGTTTVLGTLGGNYSAGEAVNNAGQVTGWAQTSGEIYNAFLYSSGKMLDLGTFGGNYSNGLGISNSGQVTGWAQDSSGYYNAFLYSDGTMTDLGTLGGTSSIGYAINDLGQVTGWAYTGDGSDHAFVYSDGQMIDLNTAISPSAASAWTLLTATDINNAGQITGYGVLNGQPESYLLTPDVPSVDVAPLPGAASAGLVLLGLAGGAILIRTRRCSLHDAA
jgi:probable HAF family extracellular repeat protein